MTSIRSIFRLKRKKKKLTNTLRTFVLIKYFKKKNLLLNLVSIGSRMKCFLGKGFDNIVE